VVLLVVGDEAISIFIDPAVSGSIQADRAPNSFPQSNFGERDLLDYAKLSWAVGEEGKDVVL
jgi:hypothetical protein